MSSTTTRRTRRTAKAMHGMTEFDYLQQVRIQRGTCAICPTRASKEVRLQWDHDHDHCPGSVGCRECVRGLLCGPCNTRLAAIENAFRAGVSPFLGYLSRWVSGRNTH